METPCINKIILSYLIFETIFFSLQRRFPEKGVGGGGGSGVVSATCDSAIGANFALRPTVNVSRPPPKVEMLL